MTGMTIMEGRRSGEEESARGGAREFPGEGSGEAEERGVRRKQKGARWI